MLMHNFPAPKAQKDDANIDHPLCNTRHFNHKFRISSTRVQVVKDLNKTKRLIKLFDLIYLNLFKYTNLY